MATLDITDSGILSTTDDEAILPITHNDTVLPITNTEGGALDITNPAPEV